MKKFYLELFSLAVTFMFGIIWVIPLKGLAKFVLVQEGVFTMGSYSTIGVVLFSIFSGLISYVIAKSRQCLKGKPGNMNFAEFAFIFTNSMVLTTIFIFFGYPLLGFLVSGGIGSYIIPYLVHLYEQGELKVPLTVDKGTYMNTEKPKEGKSISSKPITDEGSSIKVKGGGSSSKSELDTEIAISHTNVIIHLNKIISQLKVNNNIAVAMGDELFNLDFSLLLNDNTLKTYGEDLSKHLLWVIIDKQSKFCQVFIDNRFGWVQNIMRMRGDRNSWPEVNEAFADVQARRQKLTLEYENKVKNISHKNGAFMSFKQFFDINNWYTKALLKEANYVENVLNDKLRKDPIYANPEFKKILTKEYFEVKKTFSDQDSYLRKQISEAYEAQAAAKKN